MEIKFIEVRNAGTFIPPMAIRVTGDRRLVPEPARPSFTSGEGMNSRSMRSNGF
jgi:hypothetical protein